MYSWVDPVLGIGVFAQGNKLKDDHTFPPGIFLCNAMFISVSGPLGISLTAKTELKETTVANLQLLGHTSRTLPTELQCSP